MRLFVLITWLIFAYNATSAQDIGDKFVIATIERVTSSNLHKKETDYWIIPIEQWKATSTSVFPLYISGFSVNDFKECCTDKELVLFNATTQEDFKYNPEFATSLKTLVSLVEGNRKQVQSVSKKWTGGYREKITVYLTPVVGQFCFCSLTDGGSNANTKLGYDGKAAVPLSGFKYDETFWSSIYAEQIGRFDFSKLPFMALQSIQ